MLNGVDISGDYPQFIYDIPVVPVKGSKAVFCTPLLLSYFDSCNAQACSDDSRARIDFTEEFSAEHTTS